MPLGNADPNEYDALLLPGGVQNPDTLRMNECAVRFVKSFFEARKPVAAICHGPWTLVEADVVRDQDGWVPSDVIGPGLEHVQRWPDLLGVR